MLSLLRAQKFNSINIITFMREREYVIRVQNKNRKMF